MTKKKRQAIIRLNDKIVEILHAEKDPDVGLEALMYCLNAWILQYADEDGTLDYAIGALKKGHEVSKHARDFVSSGLAMQ